MIRLRRPWAGDDAGLVAGMEAVIFGVLVFVIGSLVVANAAGVIDAKLAVTAASREATRAFVEAGSQDEAEVAARQAAAATIAGHGRDPSRMEVDTRGSLLGRCEAVTVEVRYPVPIVAVPLLDRPGRTMHVSARHREVVDPYRSGLEAGGCGVLR